MGELIKFPEKSPKAFLRNLFTTAVYDMAAVYTDDEGTWLYSSFHDTERLIEVLKLTVEALEHEQRERAGQAGLE